MREAKPQVPSLFLRPDSSWAGDLARCLDTELKLFLAPAFKELWKKALNDIFISS